MTTTPTDTGPASAPRPTSSMPASTRCPSRCNARSTRSEGFFDRVTTTQPVAPVDAGVGAGWPEAGGTSE